MLSEINSPNSLFRPLTYVKFKVYLNERREKVFILFYTEFIEEIIKKNFSKTLLNNNCFLSMNNSFGNLLLEVEELEIEPPGLMNENEEGQNNFFKVGFLTDDTPIELSSERCNLIIILSEEMKAKFYNIWKLRLIKLIKDNIAKYIKNSKLDDDEEFHDIVFDLSESLCRTKSTGNSIIGRYDNVVNQLLTKEDDVNSLNNIIIKGITKIKDLFHKSILGSRRHKLKIKTLDEKRIHQILNIYSEEIRKRKILDDDIGLAQLEEITKDYIESMIIIFAYSNTLSQDHSFSSSKFNLNVGYIFNMNTFLDFFWKIQSMKVFFGEDLENNILFSMIKNEINNDFINSKISNLIEKINNLSLYSLLDVLGISCWEIACYNNLIPELEIKGFSFLKILFLLNVNNGYRNKRLYLLSMFFSFIKDCRVKKYIKLSPYYNNINTIFFNSSPKFIKNGETLRTYHRFLPGLDLRIKKAEAQRVTFSDYNEDFSSKLLEEADINYEDEYYDNSGLKDYLKLCNKSLLDQDISDGISNKLFEEADINYDDGYYDNSGLKDYLKLCNESLLYKEL